MDNISSLIDPKIQETVHGIDLTFKTILVATGGKFQLDFDNELRLLPEMEHFPIDWETYGEITLPPNTSHVIIYNEFIKIPSGYCGLVLPRSSLLRGGATLYSALWDSGYEGRGTGVLHVGPTPLILLKNARIGQMIFLKADTTKKYEGVYNRERIKIWTDGSVAGTGSKKIVSCSYHIEGGDGIKYWILPNDTTINQAEYMAIIKALKNEKAWDVEIVSDSRLAICQINTRLGRAAKDDIMKLRNASLKILAEEIIELTKDRRVMFTWQGRNGNKADLNESKLKRVEQDD